MWVLESVYGRSSDDIATAIEMLLNHRDLVLQDSETVATALGVFRSHPRVGFSDCLMLHGKRVICPLARSIAISQS
jgi:predicted nucleic-acid-binding protein